MAHVDLLDNDNDRARRPGTSWQFGLRPTITKIFLFGTLDTHKFTEHTLKQDILSVLRWPCWQNFESHWLHDYLTPSCTDILCVLRLLCWLNFESHWLHEYLTPSCTDILCVLRLPCCLKFETHWLHEYLIPSCTDNLCVLRWPSRLNFESH